MPKKFKGENSKAAEARARKNAIVQEETSRKLKAAEDEYWRDDDKHVAKKQQRKEDKEKKRLEQLERKQEGQKLLDEEMSTLKSTKAPPSAKVTRAEIAAQQKQAAAAATAEEAKAQKATVVTDLPLEENVNKLETEGEARTVADAISVLSMKEDKGSKHPEKRVKAAYEEYEKKNLPILKSENPNLRLSQLKQMLKKDWMKSPENPLNQKIKAYNEK